MQNNFGKYLKFAEANEEVYVTKNGKTVAKLIAAADPETAAGEIKEQQAGYAAGEWVSYEEFTELADRSEQRYELIDGVVYLQASPSFAHQHVVHELHGAFYNWFKGKSCSPLPSPLDVTLVKQPDNICVVQPDLVVICDREQVDANGKYKGTPTLVVEVLSPATRGKDMLKKLDLYRQCGVREYWIVDPVNELVVLYAFADNDISDYRSYSKKADRYAESLYFEGLRADLQELFGT